MEWKYFSQEIAYDVAHGKMEECVASIRERGSAEQIWLLEHKPVITLGTSYTGERVESIQGIPVRHVGRGGKATYHGPGQRIIYVMMDLRKRGIFVSDYMKSLQAWVVCVLDNMGIESYAMRDPLGVWVDCDERPHKIAAFGVRVSRGVAWHGISVNIATDLQPYHYFEPCGLAIENYGVTSLTALTAQKAIEPAAAFRNFDKLLFKHRDIVYSDTKDDTYSRKEE